MQISQLHEWNLSPENAKAVQKNLRAWIVEEDQFNSIKTFARVKVKTFKNEPIVKATVFVRSYPDLKLIEKRTATFEPKFPVLSGLSSFRTAPAAVEALKLVQKPPDLIICDGLGVIDETEFGLASHIGLLTQKPTIGVKKPSKDLGFVEALEDVRGSWLPIPLGNEIVGAVIRVVEGIEPIQASPGHYISISSAIKYTLACFHKELNNSNENSGAVDINQAKKAAQQ